MVCMAQVHPGELDAIQGTLLITLAARARETRRRLSLLRDPMAVEIVRALELDMTAHTRGPVGDRMLVLRTAIFDAWVREFLAGYPAGTVVEIGTGLNSRFERTDNGRTSWIDMDLPEAIRLRGSFFADTARRRMIAASAADETWMLNVLASPGPYFFAAEAVLVYLTQQQVTAALTRLAERFPGSYLALDTYPRRSLELERQLAAKRNYAAAPMTWTCDDPRSLERLGWQVVDTAALTRPPASLRAQLPAPYRVLLPLADPFLGKHIPLTLLQAGAG